MDGILTEYLKPSTGIFLPQEAVSPVDTGISLMIVYRHYLS